MRRMGLAVVLAVGLFAVPLVAEGQQPQVVYRVGVLSPFSASFGPGPSFEAFRQTFRELGYVEGRNVALEYRWADGRSDRFDNLAAELVPTPGGCHLCVVGYASIISCQQGNKHCRVLGWICSNSHG
jgi:putative ABC transport system substrate-binding protein